MNTIHPLTQWVINKIETEYKEDVALLIGIEGHSTNEDFHGECFDYFVPATERGYKLSETFIIDGIGHDLYPRSWERLEQSVKLNEMALLIDKAVILYAKSDEDENRFLDMQKRLKQNLQDDTFVYAKALESMDRALEIYRTLIFEGKSYRIRCEAFYIHKHLSQAVAFLNHTYTESSIFTERQAYNEDAKSRIYHCPEMTVVPDGFFSLANKLLRTDNDQEISEIILGLLKSTRNFILDRKPSESVEYRNNKFEELADWYQEMSLTWSRIRYFCEHQMVEEAYTDACLMQEEFLTIACEFGIEELNLLDSFDPTDLSLLALRSNQLEQYLKELLAGHGITLNSYTDLEEFLEKRS